MEKPSDKNSGRVSPLRGGPPGSITRRVSTVHLGFAWEHTFVTEEAPSHVRFRRAIERRALWMAEDAARELPNLPLEDALQLVHLYFERGSPKAEPAARRWLVRYLSEGTPSLRDVAKFTATSCVARARSGRASLGLPMVGGPSALDLWQRIEERG